MLRLHFMTISKGGLRLTCEPIFVFMQFFEKNLLFEWSLACLCQGAVITEILDCLFNKSASSLDDYSNQMPHWTGSFSFSNEGLACRAEVILDFRMTSGLLRLSETFLILLFFLWILKSFQIPLFF